ncbi:MAG: hypothetical protein ACRCUY_10185 [Thermoguttaceae bacterium]
MRVFCALFVLFSLVSFLVVPSDAANQKQQDMSALSAEELALLDECASKFRLLVEKYSQLFLEYTSDRQVDNRSNHEISRIWVREGGYYRWDVESEEGVRVFLALPGRGYRFAKKRGDANYTLVSKGDDEESKKIALIILSNNVLRAPFAWGPIPLWYDFDFLDHPSFEHICFDEYRGTAPKDTVVKFLSVTEQSAEDGIRVSIETESTAGGPAVRGNTVFLRNKCWALVFETAGTFVDGARRKMYEYLREYGGDVNGIPLLKKVSEIAYSDDELTSREDFIVTQLNLWAPPESVFDPKQFLPSDARGEGLMNSREYSVWRIVCMVTGIILILLGIIWMKIRQRPSNPIN